MRKNCYNKKKDNDNIIFSQKKKKKVKSDVQVFEFFFVTSSLIFWLMVSFKNEIKAETQLSGFVAPFLRSCCEDAVMTINSQVSNGRIISHLLTL